MAAQLTHAQKQRTFTAAGLTYGDVELMHDFCNPAYRIGWIAMSLKQAHETLAEVQRALSKSRDEQLRMRVGQRVTSIARTLDLCVRATGDTHLRPEA